MPRASAVRKQRFLQAQQVEAQSHVIPAPVGGLNARDAWANMPETDAISLDNWFCQPTWVELRRGRVTQATFSGTAQTVSAYNSLSGVNQLFAGVLNASVGSVYRVDNTGGGPVGAAVVGGPSNTIQAVTNVFYDWLQFGTGSAEILYLLNGADAPLLYDGTTWYSITTSSTPYALTGGPASLSSLSQVSRYKSRLWFVQGGTFNVYYLPQNVFAGALTLLNMAPNFNLGGSLACIATNSIDNAAGLNDYIAFISTQGEVVMYQGYDPSSVSTWSEAGHFRIGRPLGTGRRIWQKIGSDAVVICADGLIPLSKALVSDRSQEAISISDKIRKAISDDVQNFGNVAGWQLQLYPGGLKLLLNVPTIVNQASYQYVQNTISGSWSTFGKIANPWNALCFETQGDNLYFGTAGNVSQCDTGLGDGGIPYLGTAMPAFSYMDDEPQLKQFTLCQPILQTSSQVSLNATLNLDFDTTGATSTVKLSTPPTAQWDVSLWNTSYWGDALQISKPWLGLTGVGYAASLQMRILALNLTAKWQSTKFLFKPGSLFYGP